jgi:hypothetical protein
LTATPDAFGGVTLVVDAAPAGAVTIYRSDVNGYGTVRQPAAWVLSGTTRTMTDYECALRGAVRYALVDSAGAQVTARLTMPGTVPAQLRRVYAPDRVVSPDAVLSVAETRTQRLTRHEVVGRSDDVFTTYLQGLRTGTIVYTVASHARARAVERLYRDGAPVMLRQPDHDALDVVHIGLNTSPALSTVLANGAQVWTVTVNYAEVQPAAVNSIALYWTCARLLSVYPTSVQASVAYASWAGLVADDRGA